jgi:hypothetical protein
MYRKNTSIEHDTSMNLTLEQIIDNTTKMMASKTNGTWYQVRITEKEYYYFRNNLEKVLQHWFTYAMMQDSPKIYVNGGMPKPFHLGKPVKRLINYKQKQITCHFYCDCSQSELPDENRHIVYTVFGKRIFNEHLEFEHHIVDDQRNRIFGIVDVSVLAKYLLGNKEEFQKHHEVNNVKQKIEKAFYDFLIDIGFIKDSRQQALKADIFTNQVESGLTAANDSNIVPGTHKSDTETKLNMREEDGNKLSSVVPDSVQEYRIEDLNSYDIPFLQTLVLYLHQDVDIQIEKPTREEQHPPEEVKQAVRMWAV